MSGEGFVVLPGAVPVVNEKVMWKCTVVGLCGFIYLFICFVLLEAKVDSTRGSGAFLLLLVFCHCIKLSGMPVALIYGCTFCSVIIGTRGFWSGRTLTRWDGSHVSH